MSESDQLGDIATRFAGVTLVEEIVTVADAIIFINSALDQIFLAQGDTQRTLITNLLNYIISRGSLMYINTALREQLITKILEWYNEGFILQTQYTRIMALDGQNNYPPV